MCNLWQDAEEEGDFDHTREGARGHQALLLPSMWKELSEQAWHHAAQEAGAQDSSRTTCETHEGRVEKRDN